MLGKKKKKRNGVEGGGNAERGWGCRACGEREGGGSKV